VRCVVSTDNAEIASVASLAGAAVVDRPADLAGDDSSMVEVVAHAAAAARESGVQFRAVMLLQPTNPLRPLDMIARAIARFRSEACDGLVAVSRRNLKLGQVADGAFLPAYPPDTPSRDMPPSYYENGLLYITKVDVLMERHSLIGDRVLAFETERPFDEVDIDEPVDLVIGEAILRAVRDRLGY
jgi:N-acylneuraminate cytidylyltransferase